MYCKRLFRLVNLQPPRTLILFGFLGIAALVAMGCDQTQSARDSSSSSSKTSGTVQLQIDFNGRKPNKDLQIPCSSDSTVYSILERAQNIGDLNFESNQATEPAKLFIKSIDKIENEGANGDNWVYRVNGELAKVGCGAFVVKPTDKIVWRLGSYP